MSYVRHCLCFSKNAVSLGLVGWWTERWPMANSSRNPGGVLRAIFAKRSRFKSQDLSSPSWDSDWWESAAGNSDQ